MVSVVEGGNDDDGAYQEDGRGKEVLRTGAVSQLTKVNWISSQP